MGRIPFYALNVMGLFLIMNRDRDDPDQTRLYIGVALMVVGTLGILAINFWPRKKQDGAAEEQ
jgi:hypothetical protein